MENKDKKPTLDRRGANKKRSKKLTFLKFENMRTAAKIETYLKTVPVEMENKILAEKLIASLYKCSYHTLYAFSGNQIELITPVTCNHKICNICNSDRQKKIRRKYFNWFENNKTIVMLKNNVTGSKKYTTIARYNEKYKLDPRYTLLANREYNLMHLTLTVPHTKENGFKYKKFYFDEIKKAFNYMRKEDEWNSVVFGGEYGVEATKNDDGFHIHVHSLLFVKRGFRNRNKLHMIILKLWNRLTAWDGSNRTEFTQDHIDGIKKGNKDITDDFIKQLNPRGTTIFTLETIYTKDKETGKKVRNFSDEFNSEAMLYAVMETISYHFKPQMFQLSEELIDVETMIELLPAIYKQVLYFKFGCLHGEKSLNIKDDSLLDEYDEIMEFDEETGEVFNRQFFITSPDSMYHDSKGEIKVKKKKERSLSFINAHTGHDAVQQLIDISLNSIKK